MLVARHRADASTVQCGHSPAVLAVLARAAGAAPQAGCRSFHAHLHGPASQSVGRASEAASAASCCGGGSVLGEDSGRTVACASYAKPSTPCVQPWCPVHHHHHRVLITRFACVRAMTTGARAALVLCDGLEALFVTRKRRRQARAANTVQGLARRWLATRTHAARTIQVAAIQWLPRMRLKRELVRLSACVTVWEHTAVAARACVSPRCALCGVLGGFLQLSAGAESSTTAFPQATSPSQCACPSA